MGKKPRSLQGFDGSEEPTPNNNEDDEHVILKQGFNISAKDISLNNTNAAEKAARDSAKRM